MHGYPTWISTLLKDLLTLIQLIAVITAGLWAYMKFVKGRIFYPRLEVSISGTAVLRGDFTTLMAVLKVKNVGLSRIDIRQEGTALRVLAASEAKPAVILAPDWKHLGTFSVFERHGWVEPGETIEEHKLLVVAGGEGKDYLLEVHLGSGKIVWTAVSIVAASKSEDVRHEIAAFIA
ncbi:MAG: hypothetical protein JSS43_16850 [Proteobacteria bacterium]|nr:hypothetical protein [Pseudomonadota bacterium]